MNLQQLQYFKVVAELGHMTKASEALHVSQPALSMSISSLEAELDVGLFEKKGRQLQLTQCGEIFLGHVTKALHEIDLATSEMERLAQSANKEIHISSTYSLGSSLLPDIVQSFVTEHPDTVMHLRQGPNMELLQNLLESKTDFVFGRIRPDDKQYRGIQHLRLYTEKLVVLVGKDHPLAGRTSLDLEELREEDFIFFHESTGFHLIVMELFDQTSYQPNIRYNVYDNLTCASLVSANLGVALVAAMPLYDDHLVRQIPIVSPQYSEINICIAWSEKRERYASDVYLEFLEHVRSLYRGQTPDQDDLAQPTPV